MYIYCIVETEKGRRTADVKHLSTHFAHVQLTLRIVYTHTKCRLPP